MFKDNESMQEGLAVVRALLSEIEETENELIGSLLGIAGGCVLMVKEEVESRYRGGIYGAEAQLLFAKHLMVAVEMLERKSASMNAN